MGSRKYTTSHLESLDRYFLVVYMVHAGSEIFHDAKLGGGHMQMS